MKQTSFIPKSKREHGGELSYKKRRSKRPLDLNKPLHITLRSGLAKKERSLLRHKKLIEGIIEKFSKRFHVKIYSYAIVSNHIHLVVLGSSRVRLQNFFRVLSGHIAQGILHKFPLKPHEIRKPGGAPKNLRKFWDLLLYSRIVTWGRELRAVMAYVMQNTLEANGDIPDRERKRKPAYWRAAPA